MTTVTEQSAPTARPGDTAKPEERQRPAANRTPAKSTKADALMRLLSRAKGATINDMMKATGWQAHSLRGFMAGTLRKKLGRAVTSEKTDKGRIYRLALAENAE